MRQEESTSAETGSLTQTRETHLRRGQPPLQEEHQELVPPVLARIHSWPQQFPVWIETQFYPLELADARAADGHEIGLPSHCAVVEDKIALREIRGLEIGRTAAQTPLTASNRGRQPCRSRGRRFVVQDGLRQTGRPRGGCCALHACRDEHADSEQYER